MISDKQLEANRANSQKSTGPKTEAGKKRSSLNAVRHGLTGHVVVLPEEDLAAFNQLNTKLITELGIKGDHELELAKTYCMAVWNLQRAMAVQDTMFTLGLMEQVGENLNIEDPQAHNAVTYAKTFRQESEAFSRITLYTQRLTNQSKALLKQLKEVQAERTHREHYEIDEAVRIYKFKQMMGEVFDPAANGFVFSSQDIRRHIQREQLKSDGWMGAECGYDRVKYDKMTQKSAA
jgi:hypothetical protein